MSSIRDELERTMDEAEWSWLRPHAAKDALILITSELNLLEVGEAVARDETSRVENWIRTGKVRKPSAAQLAAWESRPEKKFLCLVVQPYVLMQEIFDA